MVTYATLQGRITPPGTDIGVRGRLVGTPLSTDHALIITADSRITLGPVEARTDASGSLPSSGASAFRVPLGTIPAPADLLWQLIFYPEGKTLKPWTVAVCHITTSGNIKDLAQIDLTAVDPVLASTVAANAAAAADSATASAASETAAQGWADAALSSAADADTSADAALVSENNAASSASTANTKATLATTKANEASASATDAAASAGAASGAAASTDTVFAGRINDTASATRAALNLSIEAQVTPVQAAANAAIGLSIIF